MSKRFVVLYMRLDRSSTTYTDSHRYWQVLNPSPIQSIAMFCKRSRLELSQVCFKEVHDQGLYRYVKEYISHESQVGGLLMSLYV